MTNPKATPQKLAETLHNEIHYYLKHLPYAEDEELIKITACLQAVALSTSQELAKWAEGSKVKQCA
jgi:hypothetical protein